ncbi:hypothetical protein [Micromonospora sp. NPDC093277]|uniref:hypothetical protein n=1 Tax=Micromonospora sp. NPDC093277 TaxID=3364291 RepID=UPI00380AC3F7
MDATNVVDNNNAAWRRPRDRYGGTAAPFGGWTGQHEAPIHDRHKRPATLIRDARPAITFSSQTRAR